MLSDLLDALPRRGTVEWIGLRPGRRLALEVIDEVPATARAGLIGDRYSGTDGKRHVTLIQHEHLAVIASLLGTDSLGPAPLRRNLSISGINLLALKGKRFHVGGATLEYTGQCHPCSLMEEAFGPGGYNAVRGHGGITARVIGGGVIRIVDPVTPVSGEQAPVD